MTKELTRGEAQYHLREYLEMYLTSVFDPEEEDEEEKRAFPAYDMLREDFGRWLQERR